jgi:hypothetical protein
MAMNQWETTLYPKSRSIIHINPSLRCLPLATAADKRSAYPKRVGGMMQKANR